MAKRSPAAVTDPYERAVATLMKSYWTSKGWLPFRSDPRILPAHLSPADFAHAKSQNVMFDARRITRAQRIAELIAARTAVAAPAVADAFVGSLSRRAVAQRSALASYAFARHMPNHDCAKNTPARECAICGEHEPRPDEYEDLSVLNFERLKWGGVRHDNILYVTLDLALFNTMPFVQPNDDDRRILMEILNTAASIPPKGRPSQLAKAVTGLFPSSKDERETVLKILSMAGVFEPRKYPSYRLQFVDPHFADYSIDSEWDYPMCQWRGSDGVNAAAVAEWFPWAKLRKGKWTL